MADGRRLFHKAHYNILSARIKEQVKETGIGVYLDNLGTDQSEFDAVIDAYRRLVWQLAAYFIADNPEFEPELWFERCGFDPAKMIERFNTE